MQGDVCPTAMGNPSAHAGIILRVLFRLFQELEVEKAYTDFIVKISFIELYNEELCDLLAGHLAAATTLMQPMAMAVNKKLRTYVETQKIAIGRDMASPIGREHSAIYVKHVFNGSK